MGDTVNLAARLVAKAPAGHVYATREVLRGAKTRFEQTALEPFPVKGKSRPVQAWDVGPPLRGASDAEIRLELPLVGRERELEQLRSAIAAARRGSGTLIELVGETGSGKSRLMAEAGQVRRGHGPSSGDLRGLHARHALLTRGASSLRQLLGAERGRARGGRARAAESGDRVRRARTCCRGSR